MNSYMRRNVTAEQMHSFLKDKQAWESAIALYNGPDPLEHWYNYICWYNGNIHGDTENKFRETLERCLTIFEHNDYYKQDLRMVKLWIKYIELQQNPLHFYQVLYQRGVGRQCACFYVNWAHCYITMNAFSEAESVYNLGFQLKAEPFNELEAAHTKFLYSIPQRMIYDESALRKQNAQQQYTEQRHVHANVSTVPVNPVVAPKRYPDVNGDIKVVRTTYVENQQAEHQIPQYHIPEVHTVNTIHPQISEQAQLQVPTVAPVSTQNIYNEVQHSTATAISSSLNYIYSEPAVTTAASQQDQTETLDSLPADVPLRNVKLPQYFSASSRNNYETWAPALFLEEPADPNRICKYEKHLVYPGGNIEYSPEEIRERKWRHKQQQQSSSQAANETVCQQVKPVETRERMQTTSIQPVSNESHETPKNKSIKIKFKKEKPAEVDPSKKSLNGHNTYNYTIENTYSIEPTSEDQQVGEHGRGNGFHPYQIQTSTPKIRKPKKLKSASKQHTASKYIFNHQTDSNSSDYGNQHNQYQYEDANLLLTFAKENSSQQQNTHPKPRAKNTDSMHCSTNDNANFSFNESNNYPDNSNCSVISAVCRLNFNETSRDECSTYAENSFFTSENDNELQQQRLEKALKVIETHLAKPMLDPFSNELCKAFLTKLNFPSYDSSDTINKVVNIPLPKLANTKVITLADTRYSIEKEVGRGSFGSVYKAVDCHNGSIVALKYQKPPNIWEVYICQQVRERIRSETVLPGVMKISSSIIAPNASIIATEFSPYGSLLDINNKIRQATKKVMHESLVMHFSSQILSIVHNLHKNKIIHADIKPDNFLLMRVPSTDLHYPSIRLIDFGCAIDMTLFPEGTQFRKIIQTDGFTCIQMQEGRPWSYETDLFCVAGTVHVMLFGDYMQIVKKFDTWDIKQKLPRYLKKHIWTDFFSSMLNIKDPHIMPNLLDIRMRFDEEAMKMDSELQSQIRTLSNLLHRR